MGEKTWQSHWEYIDRSFLERAIERYKTVVGYRKLLDAIPEIGSRGRSLEVGAGKAYLSRFLRARGWQTTAIDIDKNVVAANSGVVDKYVEGDMFNLPFKHRAFDLVISCGLFEHFPHDALGDIISKMGRVGRTVAAWLPDCGIEWRLLWSARAILDSSLFTKVYSYSAQDLEKLFTMSGFKDVRSGIVRFGGILRYLYVYGAQ